MNKDCLKMVKAVSFFILICFYSTSSVSEPEFIVGFPKGSVSNDWGAAQVHEIQRELKKHKKYASLKTIY